MSMYRSYLLSQNFYAKKGNEKTKGEKVYLRHDLSGPIYAIVPPERRGVKIIANGQKYFFNNFDKLDAFLTKFSHQKDYFQKILKRKDFSNSLRKLDI